MKYDTVVVESDDSCIKFNTGRIWYNIKHDAHDYFMDVELADSRPLAIHSDDIISDTKNRNQDFTIEELCYIGLMNTEGSKIYMDDKSGAVREAVFQILTGRESKYFRHVGIFETEDWVEVPAGTESGFFSGKVLSEADMNFSHALSSYIDFSRVMSTLYLEGALILTMLFAAGAIEAAPYILANFQALTHYVKTFGVRQGLDMYRYLGVQSLPNGVISWLQMDMADGDSSLDDLLPAIKENNKTSGFEKWLNKGASNNKVYFGIKDGQAKYTGITKQSINVRLNQHNYAGKGFDDLSIQYEGLTRNQARAIEQYFIENGPNELNKINSISQNNIYYKDALEWAKQYLGR